MSGGDLQHRLSEHVCLGPAAFRGGTSFSAPIGRRSRGTLSLRNTLYTAGLQVGEQVRVDCDDIDGINNPIYANNSGKGRNQRRARPYRNVPLDPASLFCASRFRHPATVMEASNRMRHLPLPHPS